MLKQTAGKEEGSRSSHDGMADMISRLRLTAEERDALQVADDVDEGLATSDCAIIGKVLSQGVLHIQTIMLALRPAWGNPKGLMMKSVGDNLFIAEFTSKQDKDRVLDCSPWTVGKRAVLIQEFDPSMRPGDIYFEEMSIWVRIKNIPFGLMNRRWGYEIAKKVGSVEKLDVDDLDRAWGAYLRAKVRINITKPLRRGISLFSVKNQKTDWYEVRYEKLPSYCYSCGIIGHSSTECSTPAERDENGLLPYSIDLRVQDDRKKKPFDIVNSQASASAGKSGTDRWREPGMLRSNTNLSNSRAFGSDIPSEYIGDTNVEKSEDVPPSKTSIEVHIIKVTGSTSKISESVATNKTQEKSSDISGVVKKRKPSQSYQEKVVKDLIMDDTDGVEPMDLAIVLFQPTEHHIKVSEAKVDLDTEKNEPSKRQRKEHDHTLNISAVAGFQPRRMP